MKPYFENEKIIIPYNLVESVKIITNNPSILVKACNDYEYFSLDQLDNYKLWLENQSPDAGKMVGNQLQKLSGSNIMKTTHNREEYTHIPSTKWVIDSWGYVTQQKFEELTKDDIEDFLYDCLRILDYAGALNNKNKGDYLIGEDVKTCSESPNNWKPTIEQVNEMGRMIGEPCRACKNMEYPPYDNNETNICDDCSKYGKFHIKPEKYQELLAKLKEMEVK